MQSNRQSVPKEIPLNEFGEIDDENVIPEERDLGQAKGVVRILGDQIKVVEKDAKRVIVKLAKGFEGFAKENKPVIAHELNRAVQQKMVLNNNKQLKMNTRGIHPKKSANTTKEKSLRSSQSQKSNLRLSHQSDQQANREHVHGCACRLKRNRSAKPGEERDISHANLKPEPLRAEKNILWHKFETKNGFYDTNKTSNYSRKSMR